MSSKKTKDEKIELKEEKKLKNKEAKKKNKEEIKAKNKEISQEKKRNRSIAFQFSIERIFSSLFGMIVFDVVYIVLMLSGFCFNSLNTVNGSITNFNGFSLNADFNKATLLEAMQTLSLSVYDISGKEHIFSAQFIGEFLYYTLSGLIVIQLVIFLFNCIFTPIKVNKRLKPLYTMTQAAKVFTKIDPTSEEFLTLQDAINNLSPNKPEQKLHTGKKELVGMEDAINDLLERMRNSYKSQIRFVSDASHELRTPIAVIQGYANMLDRWGREDKEILDESIESIKSEAENMNRLVENLLFLARGDSGRTVLRLEDLNINQLMCDIYDEFVMIDSSHEFSLDLRADINAQADASLLKQCMRILVDNAIKYSPKGTDIIMRLQKRGEKFYSVEVQDYGIGVKKDDSDKIFERFYRSDPARNRQNGGSGLGLSIGKWIADKHNGYLELLSYEDVGTRISLVLPFVVTDEPQTKPSETVKMTESLNSSQNTVS